VNTILIFSLVVIFIAVAAFLPFYLKRRGIKKQIEAGVWKQGPNNGGVTNFVATKTGCKFTFPIAASRKEAYDGSAIHQLVIGRAGMKMTILPPKTLKIRYRIKYTSGSPIFDQVDDSGGAGGMKPNARPSIRDTILGQRFWVSGWDFMFFDKEGEFAKSYRLDPQFWTDVNGQQDEVGFQKVFESDGLLVISFGGNFAEHGAFVQSGTGTATFELLEAIIS